MEQKSETTIKVKTRMSGYVIRRNPEHGDKVGTTERLEMTDGGAEQTLELNYESAVTLLGKEKADELFRLAEGGESE